MQGIHLFTFKGIPVSFHPFFLILILVLSINMESAVMTAAFAAAAILALLIHEFGHGLVARHYHLNPAIILHGFGGTTQHARPANARQDFLITFAGPAAGLLAGGISYGLIFLGNYFGIADIALSNPILAVLHTFFGLFALINIVWGIFNLIPIQPMDGAKVLNHILCKFCKPARAEKISIIISFIFAVLLLVWSIVTKNVFMMLMSGFLLMVNFSSFSEIFKSRNRGSSNAASKKRAALRAEGLYEKGRAAAQHHDWKALKTIGYQMKSASESADQLERAFELIAIAETNLGDYDAALKAIPRARQSDAVKQAEIRCRSMHDL